MRGEEERRGQTRRHRAFRFSSADAEIHRSRGAGGKKSGRDDQRAGRVSSGRAVLVRDLSRRLPDRDLVRDPDAGRSLMTLKETKTVVATLESAAKIIALGAKGSFASPRG